MMKSTRYLQKMFHIMNCYPLFLFWEGAWVDLKSHDDYQYNQKFTTLYCQQN